MKRTGSTGATGNAFPPSQSPVLVDGQETAISAQDRVACLTGGYPFLPAGKQMVRYRPGREIATGV